MNKDEVIGMNEAKDWHVCGLVVQGNPKKIAAIQTALLAIPHTEIPVVDEQLGKLVVVMQSHHQRILYDNMEAVKDIDGVIDVSLAYHQQDEQDK